MAHSTARLQVRSTHRVFPHHHDARWQRASRPRLLGTPRCTQLNPTLYRPTADEFLLCSAALIRRPIATQCATAAVLFGTGDIIAQQAVERRGERP